jgi:hypothetical protein
MMAAAAAELQTAYNLLDNAPPGDDLMLRQACARVDAAQTRVAILRRDAPRGRRLIPERKGRKHLWKLDWLESC